MNARWLVLLVATGCGGGSEIDDHCSTPGTTCLWAGTGERGYNIENPEAHRLESKLYFPSDLTFGPDGRGYIVDWNNHRVRRVEKDNRLVDVVGTDYEGDGPPEMNDRLPACNPEGAIGTTVAMNHPTDAKFGPDGKLYIAAWHNNKIRVYDPATDIVTAYGDGYGYQGDDSMACRALFNSVKAVVPDVDGTLYTIDQKNVRIRAIRPDGSMYKVAGLGTKGFSGDGGPALSAEFGFDTTSAPRPSGALAIRGRTMYLADSMNNRIRRIDLDTGMIDCIAGTGEEGYAGDGGHALQAKFAFPADLEFGPDGRLYIADRDNHVIRAMNLETGDIETVAGTGARCNNFLEECPVGKSPLETALNEPYGIAFDAAGNLYIADTHNHRIVRATR